MNILIVDDDRFVLEGIRQGIDWSSMPFEQVYMAQSVRKAKEILQTVPIGILVSDIEMPHESGLDLLRWVNEQGILLQNIFLTSYAEFSYAQQAVVLGSFHYFLKPIEYSELREIILKAAEKAAESLENQQYQQYGQYWLDNQKNLWNHFWKELALHREEWSGEKVWKYLPESGYRYRPDDRFLLMLFSLSYGESAETWRDSMREYAFKNVAEELFQCDGARAEGIVSLGQDQYLLALLAPAQAWGPKDAKLRAEEFICEYKRYFYCDTLCLIDRMVPLTQAGESAERLLEARKEALSFWNEAVLIDEIFPSQLPYTGPDLERIAILFEAGNREGIHRSLSGYLDAMEKRRGVTEEALKSLRYDMIQLVFSQLREKEIEAHRLFDNPTAARLERESLGSVRAMEKYLFYLIDAALDYGNFVEDNRSVAERLKQYIEKHLGENISRTTLAEEVYLNPDYLARLFKQEMGVSIAVYLLKRRMERARYLLQETQKPVNAIAEELGYENSSYFSKLFRRTYGVAPHELRQEPKMREDESGDTWR
ncbi:MAG: helix-turn-helix domain-containing protein [Oscillospiraceae bacterium]|nr:helix-turn-helix domain-containing protein [Oscillospiraceae bacterium]